MASLPYALGTRKLGQTSAMICLENLRTHVPSVHRKDHSRKSMHTKECISQSFPRILSLGLNVCLENERSSLSIFSKSLWVLRTCVGSVLFSSKPMHRAQIRFSKETLVPSYGSKI
jgi:hypothetical protein